MASKAPKNHRREAASCYAGKPGFPADSGIAAGVGEARPHYDVSAEPDETVGMSASFKDWCDSRGPEASARVSKILKRYEEVDASAGGRLDPEEIWDRVFSEQTQQP